MKSETSPVPLEAAPAKRWMLVDDNEDILMMLSAMVEHLTGASVECHISPAAALAAFAASPNDYELVITDYDMPGMNGMELCRRLQALCPAQKIILATGSGYFTATAARAAGFSALLHKPYPMSALQVALETAGFKERIGCAA
jgi:two-component system cell cycle sensor histidine kinase/response regulator CckA